MPILLHRVEADNREKMIYPVIAVLKLENLYAILLMGIRVTIFVP